LAKLPVLSGRRICRILENNDFSEVRRRGSHMVMQRKLSNTTITIPVPDHKEIRPGTLLSIIRQSGLPRTEFES